jgi:hypothetical protein
MREKCFYCGSGSQIDAEFLDPNTDEVHPVCGECRGRILSYRRELAFFGRLIWVGVPLFVFATVICFGLIHWRYCVLGIILGVAAAVVGTMGLRYFHIRKREAWHAH